MKKFTLAVLVLAPLWSCKAQLDRNESKKTPDFSAIGTELQQKIDSDKASSISIGVSIKGTSVWTKSFGWSDKEKKIKADDNTLYALGSLSKSITATGIFSLLSEKRLTLNDTMAPNAPIRFSNGPTIGQLLAMEGGIPHFFRYTGYTNGVSALRDDLDRFGIPVFPPGEIHHYSNMSYGLLDQIIADESGTHSQNYIRQNLFRRLDMTSTYCHPYVLDADNMLARAYDGQGDLLPEWFFEPKGGGGWYSSVSDMLKFGNFHLYNRDTDGAPILRDVCFERMHRPNKNQLFAWYANGWGVLPYGGSKPALLSNGAIAGAAASLLIVPDKEVVIVCLVNNSLGNTFTDGIAFQIAEQIVPGFGKGVNDFFTEMGPQFEPKPFKALEDEMGNWKGHIIIDDLRIPVGLSVNGMAELYIQIGERPKVQLVGPMRHQHLLQVPLAHCKNIDAEHLEECRATLNLRFDKKRATGYIMTVTQNDQPDGLPYPIAFTKE